MRTLNEVVVAAVMLGSAVTTATITDESSSSISSTISHTIRQQQQPQDSEKRELYGRQNDGGWYSSRVIWGSDKSGKSGSSSSSNHDGGWNGWSNNNWNDNNDDWHGWNSGKSGKSGSSGGGWYGWGPPPPPPGWWSAGKSGKSGSSGGGWYGWGYNPAPQWGKSGKSGSGGGWHGPPNPWSPPVPWGSAPWSYGKSGKSGSGGGGWYSSSWGGDGKSSKSKSSKGYWMWVPPPPPPKPKPTPKPTRKPTPKPAPKPTRKPTRKPVQPPPPPAPKPKPVPKPALGTVCFKKGEKVPCDGHSGNYGIVSSFLYTVETDPGYTADQVLVPLQNAILSDVASNAPKDFSGSISAEPADGIDGKLAHLMLCLLLARTSCYMNLISIFVCSLFLLFLDGKKCSHQKDADCAYVNGFMTLYGDDVKSSGGYSSGGTHGSNYVVAGYSDGDSSSSSSYSTAYNNGGYSSGGTHGSNYVVAGYNGGNDSTSSSYSTAYAVNSLDGGAASDKVHGIDACGGSTLIHDSMAGNDYSDVDGVKNVVYKENLSCPAPVIVAAKATVNEGPTTGQIVGGVIGAAFFALLALLVARKMRRKDEREEFSMGSSLDLEPNPYSSTIDVHKCTSMYCNCNRGLENVSFIPAPRNGDIAKARTTAGLAPATPLDEGNWYPDAGSVHRENKIQAPVSEIDTRRLPVEQRPLTTVSEIPHDSEIDTESEDNDDATSIPPPPPMGFHSSEMSI